MQLYGNAGLVIRTLSWPRYPCILDLFISTKKWSRLGPSCLYSVRITRYTVQCMDKFCIDSESDKGYRYPYCTDNETLVFYSHYALLF